MAIAAVLLAAPGCGPRVFQDIDGICGEWEARPAECCTNFCRSESCDTW